MLTPEDLQTPESTERIRRSIAMLTPKAWALKREEALTLLNHLIAIRDDPNHNTR